MFSEAGLGSLRGDALSALPNFRRPTQLVRLQRRPKHDGQWRIDAESHEFDQMILPRADEETIDRLRAHARETLKTELPEGYITLLRRNDGVEFNGYVIYGATEHKEPFYSGFIEANARLADPRFVLYGETGNALYAQDRTTGRWLALDVPSLDVFDEFDSFDAMLEHVLREACEE